MTRFSTHRQRELLRKLAELCRLRARREHEIEDTYRSSTRGTKESFERRERALATAHQDEIDELNAKLTARLETARLTFEAATRQSRGQRDKTVSEAELRHQEGIDSAERVRRETVGAAENNFLQDMTLAADVGAQARDTVENCSLKFFHSPQPRERDARPGQTAN